MSRGAEQPVETIKVSGQVERGSDPSDSPTGKLPRNQNELLKQECEKFMRDGGNNPSNNVVILSALVHSMASDPSMPADILSAWKGHLDAEQSKTFGSKVQKIRRTPLRVEHVVVGGVAMILLSAGLSYLNKIWLHWDVIGLRMWGTGSTTNGDGTVVPINRARRAA